MSRTAQDAIAERPDTEPDDSQARHSGPEWGSPDELSEFPPVTPELSEPPDEPGPSDVAR